MLGLGAFGFANPWLLTTLLLLPLVWWLLRVTPPAPQSILFPAIRLLFGLESEEQTPRSSPLWLILLRLFALAALIVGLAGPLINPGTALPGSGPVLLVIDDGWAAAAHWSRRETAIGSAIARAEREDRSVLVLTTARRVTGGFPEVAGPMRPSAALSYVSAVAPKPWPADHKAALAALDKVAVTGSVPVIWFSDGLRHETTAGLTERLQRFGSLEIVADPPETLPFLLEPPRAQLAVLTVAVRRVARDTPATVKVRGRTATGRLLIEQEAAFAAGQDRVEVTLDLPLELRNELARLEVEGSETAASVILLDERWQRRSVGLAASQPLDSGPVLLSEIYYIERALAPFSDLVRLPVDKLVASDRSVVLVPDAEPVAPKDRAALDNWMRQGGIVARFAGPALAARPEDDFTPVPLRRGGRTLGGALLWSEPAKLAEFSEGSPFFGLKVPSEVTVSRQVLAQPSLDLAERTWARLTDGTPLVTAERRGDGWLVLFHTTASTAWSNLPLSGLFVEMLRRVVWLSRRVDAGGAGRRPLPPFQQLDGFGRLVPPSSSATAIDAGEVEAVAVGPTTPPGYYGTEDARRAVNLSPRIGALVPFGTPPAGISLRDYGIRSEINLQPWLVLLALFLVLVDTLATLALRGLLPRGLTGLGRRSAAGAVFALVVAGALPGDLQAQARGDPETFALEAATATRLAYVLTGIEEIDSTSQAGLTGLSDVVRRRTAAELAAPLGVDPVRDELAFFPLLYWPVDGRQSRLAPEAVRRLNRYLDNGGTIVFDTRDQNLGGGQLSDGIQALRVLTQGLDIPPLVPVPPDHVLTKSFYLMQDFPGRWTGGQVWVEGAGNRINDGVTRILIGSHDWAAAWSVDEHGRALYPVVPGGEKQREMAFRFGINLVMYALTGNYKADQVHVPAILERLGQ